MNYVVGFVFNADMSEVLLIEKRKPEWMSGLFNGVGGKAEDADRYVGDTMRRECREECGLDIKRDRWTMFADLMEPVSKLQIRFFFVVLPDEEYALHRTCEREAVSSVNTNNIANNSAVVPNLRWLIPLAMNWHCAHGATRTMNVIILEKLNAVDPV